MMLFWHEKNDNPQPSPEETKVMVAKWHEWLGGIASQDRLNGSEALQYTGKSLHPNKVVTDGPYAEVKEIVSGYASIKANDLAEATKMAEGCPILDNGGWVEVREIMVFDI